MAKSIHKHTHDSYTQEFTDIKTRPAEISSFTIECFYLYRMPVKQETIRLTIIGRAFEIDKPSSRVRLRTTATADIGEEFVFIFLAP